MGNHCVVIGAGIVGASCAWHLQRKGLEVTLVDSELPGQSCRFGNAGCISSTSVILFSYPGVIKKIPGWLLDPLGPMRIRAKDFLAIVPWFWKFWRTSSRPKVEAIARALVMTPMLDGLRIAGTAEFAALDAPPDYRRAKALLKNAGRYLEGLQTNGVSEWMGQRPMMADSTPVISVSPRHENVFYAFGHGHYGLTQGPTTGRIIADMVVGNEPEIDLRPFRFDRRGPFLERFPVA